MAERVDAVGAQTSLWDRKIRAGQRIVMGLAHPHVDDDLKKIVAQIQPAGFVLFGRNVEEPAQVRELTRELASLVDPSRPALMTIDQEGGRVQRVRSPATVWPTMRDVGRVRDPALTRRVSAAMATELRALGFNLNFAPVADVDNNPANSIIGDRSFAADPRQVAEHVVAFTKGHQENGVIACAKHFPGHGDTTIDSHFALPTVEKERPDLEAVELFPFQAAVRAGVGTVMSAHVIFPAFDEDLPATLSPVLIPQVLRARFGFEGVVFSDDLEMKAVAGRWPIDEIVRLATIATVDVMLCCKEPALQLAAYESLVHQQEIDSTHEQRAKDSVRRVHALRERFFLGPQRPVGLEVLASDAHRSLADEVTGRVYG